jgi:hypothetical protein
MDCECMSLWSLIAMLAIVITVAVTGASGISSEIALVSFACLALSV